VSYLVSVGAVKNNLGEEAIFLIYFKKNTYICKIKIHKYDYKENPFMVSRTATIGSGGL
jgi:hypothetical protein